VSKKRLVVKPSAVAVWLCFALFEPSVYTALLFGVMALHECGHLLALRLCGVRETQMVISGFGAEIRYHTAVKSVWGRIFIALGGILMNLLLGTVMLYWYRLPLCLFTSVASFVLAFLNLLPVRGLDGARALEECLIYFADYGTAYAVMRWSSVMGLLLLGLLSAFVLMESGFNFSLLLFTLYLSLSIFR